MQTNPTGSTTSTSARFDKLRRIVRKAGLDVAALVPGPNLFYLTGLAFHLMERPLILLVPAEGDPAVIIPALEVQKTTAAVSFPIRIFSYSDTEGHLPAFEQACQTLGLAGKRIGVEGLKMRVVEGQLFQRYAPGCTIDAADETLMWLRMHKDATEIARMRLAIGISEAALDETLAGVHSGMTERRITTLLLGAMAKAGSEANAFEPIVLSGPNSALPHGIPSERVLQDGDLLLFDYGAVFSGYMADITRTFAVGEVDPELVKVYETVLAANLAGIRAAKPGVPAQEVDRAARKVIADAGYGEYFLHRTGHGLGIDAHEGPYIREGNAQLLEPGMVFTVEPGIYLPGKGGVRIEDDVLVTATGVDVLTSYSKSLRRIG
jgi:Xaa-Pro dipeptidase